VINKCRFLLAAFIFLILPACGLIKTHTAKATPKNIIDYLASQMRNQTKKPNLSSALYRSVGAKILYSQCKWLPSDSEYFDQLSKSCGSARAMYLAVAEFLEEPNLTSSDDHTIVYYQNRLRWLRSVNECRN
jgi:putative component of membrane protein insertase Oxa1/YidC/SpoIIIJ protein YidD